MPLPAEVVTIGTDIAVHFVLGGVERLAPRALPVVARVFHRNFGGSSNTLIDGPDLQTAQERLRPFFELLDQRIGKLEDAQELDAQRLDALFAKPEITSAFGSAVECAMLTDDTLSHESLAGLVSALLTTADESGWRPAARLACESIKNITPRQLRLLGLILFMRIDLEASDPDANHWYEMLDEHSRGLRDEQYHPNDFAALEGLGLISYDVNLGYLEEWRPPVKPLLAVHPELFTTEPHMSVLQRINSFAYGNNRLDVPALPTVTLTPPGRLIAIEVLRANSGLDMQR